MAGRSKGQRRRNPLFKFDQPYLEQHGCIAGVDEAGRGPLAGPVVAAAIILPADWYHPALKDSKQLTAEVREELYAILQTLAVAIGVAAVEHDEIDRINIRQASFVAMRLAMQRLTVTPRYVLVDGFSVPGCTLPHRGIIKGDDKSAHIAAASVIAKVTRDAIMREWDKQYPHFGFSRHKGYGTPEHLNALEKHGPSPIHRRSFAPVRACRSSEVVLIRE